MQARRSASGSEARRASWNSEQVAEGVGRAVRPVEAQRSVTAEGAAAARRDGRGGRGVGLLRAGARGAFFWGRVKLAKFQPMVSWGCFQFLVVVMCDMIMLYMVGVVFIYVIIQIYLIVNFYIQVQNIENLVYFNLVVIFINKIVFL